MIDLKELEVWFLTGSQHLYGPAALEQVAANARTVVAALDQSSAVPVRVRFQPVVKSPEEATALCQAANQEPRCIGLITWCHTFSPSKMWINGLKALRKPVAHLHTQFNRDLPWSTIDMDFMNLNQAAHGDREHGFIMSRMRLNRKVIVGHWSDPEVQQRLGAWCRAAAAWHDWQGARFCRFGDNMREVAVTEGDKVAAQMQFGYSVNGYGVGDLVQFVRAVSEKEVDELVADYERQYEVVPELRKGGARHESLREAARIEAGLRAFLKQGGFKGFTDTFEDLHGLSQLPGIAVQRLMAEGYGFGAEGDWKTCALVRAMKVMATGLSGGTSFMEDYTYHLDPARPAVLGAHMLEICPSIAKGRPRCEIHPLSIGGKADPVRLVFDTPAGPGLNASIIDLGNRFRLLVNEVEVIEPPEPLPRLPVARALWQPKPNLAVAAAAWIYAGGAHHTGFSQAVTTEMLEDFATMAGVELVVIDEHTRLRDFRRELEWNEVAYGLKRGFLA
ncbi:L-arabinose isomerase [Limisphaera ngatamarikiensis]|uniref:L-arabinose isomerase n=1 Tax=Limisphaera ngatamarikiensis TaxID=1324935 RepID=A0A6M1RJV5_9BACT|nr:L-arabinose isomerase [Limisphaera ngatamarikiensis]NGO40358.1 L-arabinose isomerase [Limisphaera ngatamarikiensis]